MKGLNSLIKKLSRLETDFNELAQTEVKLAALEIHGEAVRSIQEHRSKGAPRARGGNSSKEGSPPNTDTGALVRSIKWQIDGNTAYIGTNIIYGPMLEFGTENMGERPWLRPAFMKVAPKFTKRLTKLANETLKKAGS